MPTSRSLVRSALSATLGPLADRGDAEDPVDATAGVTHCGQLCAWGIHDQHMPWTYAVQLMALQYWVDWTPRRAET